MELIALDPAKGGAERALVVQRMAGSNGRHIHVPHQDRLENCAFHELLDHRTGAMAPSYAMKFLWMYSGYASKSFWSLVGN